MTPTRALRCGDSGSTSHRGRSHDRSRSLQAHRVHCRRIAFRSRRIAFHSSRIAFRSRHIAFATGASRSRQAHHVRGQAHRVRGRRIAFAAGASRSRQAHRLLLQAHRVRGRRIAFCCRRIVFAAGALPSAEGASLCHGRIASAADARWPIDRSASPRIAGNRAAPKLKRARQRRARYQADDPKPRVVREP
jgi:hypothetical protein